MPCFQIFLVGLMLFFSATYALATPDEAAVGKVRGFTGPADVKPSADPKIFASGDYLTAVFCYCAYPQRMEEVMGPAHFYQFEYYNWHHDTTFVVTSACPDGDIGYDQRCVPSSAAEAVLTGGTMDTNCKRWEGYETVKNKVYKRTDEFCYLPHHKENIDYMFFNGQKRRLDKQGHQGPKATANFDNDVCEHLCQENMGMSALKDSNFPSSHQIEWTDLDDMCQLCE